ncbi:MAG: polyphosphate:AMP phosphotransferase [Fusobacteriaceae bacterium]
MFGIFEQKDCLKLKKKQYKEIVDPLKEKLGELQRKAKEKKVPILIIFEGLEASGKGAGINELLLSLDPRGYKVVSNDYPCESEGVTFKKYWENLPGKGEFNIFDRSWYYCAFNKKEELTRRCNEINETEKTLLESGMIIIKFFMFISKKEQKNRYLEAESDKATAWKVSKEDWEKNKNYKNILKDWENVITQTNNSNSEWNLVCGDDLRGARAEIYRTVVETLEVRLEEKLNEPEDLSLPYRKPRSLDKIDLNKSLTKDEYTKKITKLQNRIFELHHELYIRKIPVVIAYEGWDAGGKGGNIRRLVERMDPRGYDVIPVAAPNDYERIKHYLWRFWKSLPKAGHITIFDRTWYGRVLVERVEGFASKYEWKRAYKEINDMEKQWVDDKAIIIKFWLHISPEEQLKRFNERKDTPNKNWKITEEDWRNREKWDQYKVAVEEMIARTSEPYAPWSVIPGNDKYYARVFALDAVVKAIEKRLEIENKKLNIKK